MAATQGAVFSLPLVLTSLLGSPKLTVVGVALNFYLGKLTNTEVLGKTLNKAVEDAAISKLVATSTVNRCVSIRCIIIVGSGTAIPTAYSPVCPQLDSRQPWHRPRARGSRLGVARPAQSEPSVERPLRADCYSYEFNRAPCHDVGLWQASRRWIGRGAGRRRRGRAN